MLEKILKENKPRVYNVEQNNYLNIPPNLKNNPKFNHHSHQVNHLNKNSSIQEIKIQIKNPMQISMKTRDKTTSSKSIGSRRNNISMNIPKIWHKMTLKKISPSVAQSGNLIRSHPTQGGSMAWRWKYAKSNLKNETWLYFYFIHFTLYLHL
jgi:hypothetical protein